MIVDKLTRALEKLNSALIDASPNASIAGALSKLGELDHAFHSVSPLPTYLRLLLDEVQDLKRLINENEINVETLNEKSQRISNLINEMVKKTLRSSNELKALMITLILSLIASSVVLFFYSTAPTIHIINAALSLFVIIMGGALILAISMCMNSSILLIPLLSAVVVAQGAIYISVNSTPEAWAATIVTIAIFVVTLLITSRTVRNFKNVMIYVLHLESAVESLATSLKREKERLEAVSKEQKELAEIAETEQRQQPIKQRELAELRALFERVYGSRASELLKYLEDVKRLSSRE